MAVRADGCDCLTDDHCGVSGPCTNVCYNFDCVDRVDSRCDDNDPCTMDQCDPIDGACVHHDVCD